MVRQMRTPIGVGHIWRTGKIEQVLSVPNPLIVVITEGRCCSAAIPLIFLHECDLVDGVTTLDARGLAATRVSERVAARCAETVLVHVSCGHVLVHDGSPVILLKETKVSK